MPRTDGLGYGCEGSGSPSFSHMKLPALLVPWQMTSLGQKEIPLLPKRTERWQVLGQVLGQSTGSSLLQPTDVHLLLQRNADTTVVMRDRERVVRSVLCCSVSQVAKPDGRTDGTQ